MDGEGPTRALLTEIRDLQRAQLQAQEGGEARTLELADSTAANVRLIARVLRAVMMTALLALLILAAIGFAPLLFGSR